jgi:hypothetical protein
MTLFIGNPKATEHQRGAEGLFACCDTRGNHRKRNKSYARPMSSTLFVLSTLYQA